MPTTLSLPPHAPDALPRAARVGIALGMLGLHAGAVWFLLQFDPVREAAGRVVPILIEFIAPPAPRPAEPVSQPKPALPTAVRPRVATIARPPSAAEPALAAPQPEPEPSPTARSEAPPTPSSLPVQDAGSAATAAPATPAAPSAPTPRTVAISAVAYLSPPVLRYPAISRRMGEQGQVLVRVLVDSQGSPREAQVVRSSGHPRLDEAALTTVRATRFKPYTENGITQPFWVVMPLIFELED